jgi:tetratricopeptide (TPR) repeat protein
LVDVTSEVGIDFVHNTGASGQFYFPEITGSGAALLDFDGDGDLDVYLVQSGSVVGSRSISNRLYRNDDEAGAALRFTDVTVPSRTGDTGYGMGAATADFNNDGHVDVLVTNFGPDVLYRNTGKGSFEDVTRSAGLGDATQGEPWSSSATFVDYDRDGWLDLYVVKYVQYNPAENHACHSRLGRRDYCGPAAFDPATDVLYRNRGDGTFENVTVSAGINHARGSGLGVVAVDVNSDAWPDLLVANDGNANILWINNGDGTFTDQALLAGAAYNGSGMAEAGMGVSAADFDEDGDHDLILTHLLGEHNTLLVNDGAGWFDDHTARFGMDRPSRHLTGFGVQWFDLEGDGDLDLFAANGAVKIAEQYADRHYPYMNPDLLMVNEGPPRFILSDRSVDAGSAVTTPTASRGAAFGDLDNDGDVDVVVTQSHGAARILLNRAGDRGKWLRLQIVGTHNRAALGATVELALGSRRILRRVHRDGSYLSANDPRVTVGVPDDSPRVVVVTWPDGLRERFNALVPGTLHILREGAGQPASTPNLASSSMPVPIPPVVQPQRPLDPLPELDLSRFDPHVRTQIESAQRSVHDQPDNAAAHGALGVLYHAYDLLIAAVRSYEAAVQHAPQDPRWNYYLGLACAELGDWPRASEAFERVLAEWPDHIPAVLRGGTAACCSGRLKKAELLFQSVARKAPSPGAIAAARCGIGRVRAARGQHDAAVAELSAALAVVPRYGEARYLLGQSLRHLGQHDAAKKQLDLAGHQNDDEPFVEDALRRALEISSRGAIALLHDGLELAANGDPSAALARLERAASLRPDLAEARAALGSALLQLGQFDKANVELKRAVAIEPHYVQALYNLGLLRHRQAQFEEAVQYFEAAVAVRPSHFESLLALGQDLQRLDRPADAVQRFRAAVQARPEDARAYKQLAMLLIRTDRPYEAIALLEDGHEILPLDQSITDRLAWVLATTANSSARNPERALRLAREVCAVTGDREPRALDTLAAALAANGDFEGAVRAMDRAINTARAGGRERRLQGMVQRRERYLSGSPYIQDHGK